MLMKMSLIEAYNKGKIFFGFIKYELNSLFRGLFDTTIYQFILNSQTWTLSAIV